MCVHVYVSMCGVCVYLCMHVYACVCMHVYICVCMCVCLSVCMCACACVPIQTEYTTCPEILTLTLIITHKM